MGGSRRGKGRDKGRGRGPAPPHMISPTETRFPYTVHVMSATDLPDKHRELAQYLEIERNAQGGFDRLFHWT